MDSFRASLPPGFLDDMLRSLGRERSLRLLWPLMAGPQLAAHCAPRGIRGRTLLLAVPDRTWGLSLRSFEPMLLEAVNRFLGADVVQSVEYSEDPTLALPGYEPPRTRRKVSWEQAARDFHAEGIADASVRGRFLESARKYFAWQEERRA